MMKYRYVCERNSLLFRYLLHIYSVTKEGKSLLFKKNSTKTSKVQLLLNCPTDFDENAQKTGHQIQNFSTLFKNARTQIFQVSFFFKLLSLPYYLVLVLPIHHLYKCTYRDPSFLSLCLFHPNKIETLKIVTNKNSYRYS